MSGHTARIAAIAVVLGAAVTGASAATARLGCGNATVASSPALSAPATVSAAPTAIGTTSPATAQPAWAVAPLTDACTSASFTLHDCAGRAVYVEAMAPWCPPCQQQLGNTRAAKAKLRGDDYVFVALSTEVDLANHDLAAYAHDNRFDFFFAVMSPQMLAALVDQFGRAVVGPPSTPHFSIAPDGKAGALQTRFTVPDDLVKELTAAEQGAAQ